MAVEIHWEEHLEVLKRSFSPTLVIEGRDDYICLRGLEEKFIESGFTIFPVKGKSNVIEIFKRRSDIQNTQVIFLVDNDEWLIFGKPSEFDEPTFLTTDGWSIENDMLRDGTSENLMSVTEREQFEREFANFSQYFAAALQDYADNGEDAVHRYRTHPNQVLTDGGDLTADALSAVDQINLSQTIQEKFFSDVRKAMRGKSLLSLYTRLLSKNSRASKYSAINLLEMSAATRGPHYQRIESQVEEMLGI